VPFAVFEAPGAFFHILQGQLSFFVMLLGVPRRSILLKKVKQLQKRVDLLRSSLSQA